MQRPPLYVIVVAAFLGIGCDAQVNGDYLGEPLTTVVGTISNEMTSPPSNARVALIWVNSATSPDLFVGDSVPASAHFPADFSIKLYTVPPDAVLNDHTNKGQFPEESRIGLAWISVGVPDASGQIVLDPESAGPLIGLAENHVLAYVDKDILPGTYSEALLHGQLKAGYHVLDVKRQSDGEVQRVIDCQAAAATREERIACGMAGRDLFHDAPLGMKTRIPVRLTDESDQLEGPDLK